MLFSNITLSMFRFFFLHLRLVLIIVIIHLLQTRGPRHGHS